MNTTSATVSALILRHWATALGTTPRRLLGALVAAASVATAVATLVEPPAVSGPGPEAVLMGLTLAGFAVLAAFAIFAGHTATLPGPLGFLRTLPVSPGDRHRGTTLPSLAIGLVAGGPALVVLAMWLHRFSGYEPAWTAAITVVLVAGAAAAGRLLLALSHRVLTGPGTASLRLTAAFLGWLALIGLSLWWPPIALETVGWPAAATVSAPLVWPAAWWALVDGPGVAVVAASGATAVVWTVGRWLRRPDPLPAERIRKEVVDAGLARARGPALVAALVVVVRVRRHPRTLEALVVSGSLAAVTVLASGWLGPRITGPTVALLASQVACGFGVLVRGLSDRCRPAEAALGLTAGPRVVGAFGATVALAQVAGLPALAILALRHPLPVTLIWFGAVVCHAAMAIGVSTLLVPSVGNGGAEATAVLAYALVDSVVLRAFGPLSGIAAVVALGGAIALENRRRPR